MPSITSNLFPCDFYFFKPKNNKPPQPSVNSRSSFSQTFLSVLYIRFIILKIKSKSPFGDLGIMKTKTVTELKQMLDAKENFQLIDVREEHEFEICNLNGELIPMGEIPDNVEKISKDKPVVVHCRSGKRSGNVIQYLESNFGYTNLYNLEGGILAWADEIDNAMPKY